MNHPATCDRTKAVSSRHAAFHGRWHRILSAGLDLFDSLRHRVLSSRERPYRRDERGNRYRLVVDVLETRTPASETLGLAGLALGEAASLGLAGLPVGNSVPVLYAQNSPGIGGDQTGPRVAPFLLPPFHSLPASVGTFGGTSRFWAGWAGHEYQGASPGQRTFAAGADRSDTIGQWPDPAASPLPDPMTEASQSHRPRLPFVFAPSGLRGRAGSEESGSSPFDRGRLSAGEMGTGSPTALGRSHRDPGDDELDLLLNSLDQASLASAALTPITQPHGDIRPFQADDSLQSNTHGGLTFHTAEGQSFDGKVGSLTNGISGGSGGSGGTDAVIDWGDGTSPTAGKILGLDIDGSHTYAEEGTYTVDVTVTTGAGSYQVLSTADVADMSLTANGLTFAANRGLLFKGPVATFMDLGGLETNNNYRATVDWGDGVVTNDGMVTGPMVLDGHTYVHDGSYAVTVTVVDEGGQSATATSTATVTDSPLVVQVLPLSATEGQFYSGPVATFTDPGGLDPNGGYSATILWSDQTTSTGAVNGSTVSGSHLFAEEGAFPVTVTVTKAGQNSSGLGMVNVLDAPLTANPVAVQAVQGIPFTLPVATFTDAGGPETGFSDYSATILWGDNSGPDNGAISLSGNLFTVTGSHTYAQSGPFSAQVIINHDAASSVQVSSSVSVSSSGLVATGIPIGPTEGSPFQGVVASFTDSNPGSYQATVTWEDMTTSPGTVNSVGNSTFTVTASRTYVEEGTYPFSVAISKNGGGMATASSTATVADAPLSALGVSIPAIEGTSLNGTVATFTDPAGFESANSYTVTIEWGDGQTTSGGAANGVVTGSHVYGEQGTYPVRVTVADDGGSTATAVSTATVTDAPLTVTGQDFATLTNQVFIGPVANFSDPAGSLDTSATYTAGINWGDNSQPTAGVVAGTGILGNHVYAAAGTYTVQVTVSEDGGGSPVTATATATVTDPPPPPPKPVDCGCATGQLTQEAQGMSSSTPDSSSYPVRYFDGTVKLSSTDLASTGFGTAWGVDRSWTNSSGYAAGNFSGSGTVVGQQPYLRQINGNTTLALITNGTNSTYFDLVSANYVPRFFTQDRLVHQGNEFILTDTTGNQLHFADFTDPLAFHRGQLKMLSDSAGNQTNIVSTTADGKPQEVQRTTNLGGETVTESYLYTYFTGGITAGLVQTVTSRQRYDSGPWTTVRQTIYTYYDGSQLYGNGADLKTATIEDSAGTVLDATYYRYYTADSATGYKHGVKYVFNTQSYSRLRAAVGNPFTATDDQVKGFADNYFEYGTRTIQGRVDHPVTKEVAQGAGSSTVGGGLGTFAFSYSVNPNLQNLQPTDYNFWVYQTTETLPDGNLNKVYANQYGQVMLSIFHDTATSRDWETFYKYDNQGRNVLTANPSALSGYDDHYSDLLNADANGHYQYMRDNTGLVEITDYAGATTAGEGVAGDVAGYVKDTKLRQGQTPVGKTEVTVLQSSTQYYAHTGGGTTVYPVAATTTYRNTDGSGAETTQDAYTWYTDSTQELSMTVTRPVVSSAQNGPGVADVEQTYYDTYGREIWHKDADGFLTYTAYDQATGAVVKTIQDVDTTQTGDFSNLPAGWSTPPGGGLHLVARMEVDSLGRTTALTKPDGNVTYTVYLDAAHEERAYSGWYRDTNGTYHTTGPIQVTREDRGNDPSYTETFTMAVNPGATNGRPDGSEAIGNLQTLSRTFTSPGGQGVETDNYFNLSGLTYSQTPYLGSAGQVQPNGTVTGNYWATTYGYDARGRQNREQDPTGTVTRTDYDGLSRVTDVWTGTSDANLVKVSHDDYDQDQPQGIGDGNLTAVTGYPGSGAAARVTQNYYDWRDRLVADKEGVQGTEDTTTHRPITYRDYDNRNEVVAVERYDGDTVTVTTTNGVPNRPAETLRRTRTTTAYDDQGRVYETDTYNVSQTTGTLLPSDAAPYRLVSSSWYDHRGNPIKTSAPGGLVTKLQHDGAGRAVQSFQTDGAGDMTWNDAGQVGMNNVLTQTATSYDGNGNTILVTTLDRFHNAAATGPLSRADARIRYVAQYYDLADRPIATVDVGTNGGTDYTRPNTVPDRSNTVLVTSQAYNDAGWVADVRDPRNITTHTEYDNLGRTVKTVEDYTDGIPTNFSNRTTIYTYDGAGHTLTLTAVLPQGLAQTTQYVYGVSPATGSSLTSNDLLAAMKYPDKNTGLPSDTEKETYTYDALGEMTGKTDRNGTTHAYTFDVLGRQTADRVTTLGQRVDAHVLRLETAYDTGGRPYLYTSYDAATSGNVVNQVEQLYNGLGQLTAEFQSHAGIVTAGTPEVQYTYTEMTKIVNGMPMYVNNSRMTGMVYPNGRILHYGYNAGLDDSISRPSFLADDNGSGNIGTHLEEYLYLGLDTVVARAHPQPGVDLSYIKQTGEPNGDAGDQYTGLDRFGRVVDQRWVRESNGSATDRFQYGYDADGNPLYRDNLVEPTHSFGELYQYDMLNRLTSFGRGMLNTTHDGFVGVPTHTQNWSLDIQGNWISVTTDSNQQGRTHNQQNQLTSIAGQTTPGYDANGNTTGDETGKTLVYDAWNRLVRVVGANSNPLAAYSYDALGRRITETGTTARDLYFSSSWQVLEEQVGGTTQAQYVWSSVYVDALVERDAGGQRLYVQQDANWNVTALVDTTGAVVERFVYDPYGQATFLTAAWATKTGSEFAWVYLHQGGRYEATISLYVFRNRDYSPTLGRWIEDDPSGFASGDTNLYAYVANNPVWKLDPLGLEPLTKEKWEAIAKEMNFTDPEDWFEYYVGQSLGLEKNKQKYDTGFTPKGEKGPIKVKPDFVQSIKDGVVDGAWIDAKLVSSNIGLDQKNPQTYGFIYGLNSLLKAKDYGILVFVTPKDGGVTKDLVTLASDKGVLVYTATAQYEYDGKAKCYKFWVDTASPASADNTKAIQDKTKLKTLVNPISEPSKKVTIEKYTGSKNPPAGAKKK